MSDPLSIAASIIAVLQLTGTVVKYLVTLKDVSDDVKSILLELSSMHGMLFTIQNLAASDDPWMSSIKALGGSSGPIDQLKTNLEKLAKILLPLQGQKNFGRKLAWPLQKGEVQAIILTLERLKSLFILALQNDHRSLSVAMKDGINQVADKLNSIHSNQEGDKRRDILDWLSPVDTFVNHRTARAKHVPGTGEWFVGSATFKDWLDATTDQFLWLHGKIGCGKTMLSSHIIETVKKSQVDLESGIAIAFFYFDFSDVQKRTAESMIRSLLVQLARQARVFPEVLVELRRQYMDKSLDIETLLETLNTVLQSFRQVFIIVDALDESLEKEDAIGRLHDISAMGNKNHILATSRRDHDIEITFEGKPVTIMEMNSSRVEEDIRLYVQSRLKEDVKLKSRPRSIKDEIEKILIQGSEGMFRWVVCQLDSLRACLTPAALKHALSSLPRTIDETYDQILSHIDEEFREQTRRALQWLAFSARPLHVDEVAEAVAVDPDSIGSLEDTRLFDPYDIFTLCSSLVTLSEESNEVRLAHASVKEYLTSDRIRQRPTGFFRLMEIPANAFIASACLSYLLTFKDPMVVNRNTKTQFPLLDYAARCWYIHFRLVACNKPASDIFDCLLNLGVRLFDIGEATSFYNWLRVARFEEPLSRHSPPDADSDPSSDDPSHSRPEKFGTPLYYASYCGLVDIASSLVDQGATGKTVPNEQDGMIWPGPLEAAVGEGYDDVVSLLLLRAGADVHVVTKDGKTALIIACMYGHASVVRTLLDYGADTSKSLNDGSTPLHCATRYGNLPIVKILIDEGADVNAKTDIGVTPLHDAVYAHRNSEAIAMLLLDNGAEIEAATEGAMMIDRGPLLDLVALMYEQEWRNIPETYLSKIRTPLYLAAFQNRNALVELFVARGANLEARTSSGATPLFVGAFQGYTDVVQTLIDHGADVQAVTITNATMFHAAASGGNAELVDLFIQKGLDPKAPDGFGLTPQGRAALGGHLHIVQKLEPLCGLHGAQHESRITLLHSAAQGGKVDVIEYLLQQSLDIDATNSRGSTPLHNACYRGHAQAAALLIKHGAKLTLAMDDGSTPLFVAIESNHDSVVDCLLQHLDAADLTHFDGDGNTALLVAISGGNEHTVKLLLEKGADPNARAQNPDGITPLLVAMKHHPSLIPLLLERGADITICDTMGWSPIVLAVELGSSSFVETLMKGQPIDVLFDALTVPDGDITEFRALGSTSDPDRKAGTLAKSIMDGLEVICWMMLHYGWVDVNTPILNGPPLVWACQFGHIDIVRLFLRMGADVESAMSTPGEEESLRAIHVAAGVGHLEIAQILIEHGCDVNAPDGVGGTALQRALLRRDDQMIRLLFTNGADLRAEVQKLDIVVVIPLNPRAPMVYGERVRPSEQDDSYSIQDSERALQVVESASPPAED